MKSKLLAVILVLALLVGVGAAVALSQPHTTLVVQFYQGALILDQSGGNVTNSTITLFNVLPTPGNTIVRNYSVENIGSATCSLTNITATTDTAFTSAISGITFPVVLAKGSSTPFVLTLTIQPTTQTSSTVLITATCS